MTDPNALIRDMVEAPELEALNEAWRRYHRTAEGIVAEYLAQPPGPQKIDCARLTPP